MKKEIYVVTMYRWGDRNCHSYVLGAYNKKHRALKEAEAEQINRGGNKYIPEVLEIVDSNVKTILELKPVKL